MNFSNSKDERLLAFYENVRRQVELDNTCAYRKSSPSILVMQSTQDRTAQNAPRCLGGT